MHKESCSKYVEMQCDLLFCLGLSNYGADIGRGCEENTWAQEGGSDRRMEKAA